MEGIDVLHRHGHRLLDLVPQAGTGVGNLLRGDLQRADLGFIKFSAVLAQGIVAARFNVVEDLHHRAGDALRGRDSRAHQQIALLLRGTAVPVDNGIKAHGHYSIIFSIGSTRIELAPSAFSFSIVSQKSVSLLTMCIATRC